MASLAVFLFVCYLALNVVVWRTYRSTPLLLLQLIVYAYFFHGYLIAMAYFAGFAGRVGYIFGYPYYVSNNEVFWHSFAFYCAFGLVYLVTVYWGGGRLPDYDSSVSQTPPLQLRASTLIVLALIAAMPFVFVYGDLILNAVRTGQSAYVEYKRDALGVGPLYALLQQSFMLSSMATVTVAVGLLGGARNHGAVQVVYGRSKLGQGVVVSCLLAALFVIALSLGDKTTIASSVVYAVCLLPQRVLFLPRLLAGTAALLIGLNTINFLRHSEYADLGISQLLVMSAFDLVEHGEFVTTFSLYTMMNQDVPLIWGESLSTVAQTVVPSFIAPDRPASSYSLFADATGIVDETGWGISYPSDWYFNFGFLGVCAGAVVLGCFHSVLLRLSRDNGVLRCIFACVVAVSLQGMREGIHLNAYLYAVALGALLCFLCRVSRTRALGQ
jgi:hypothetical protein